VRLGLTLGYWSGDGPRHTVELARRADELGYAVCFAAEAYGVDAATVLAYLAASTRRIHLGSAVFQIPGRTPAMTAMTAAGLDALSGGRFRLGLGVSGPQVSEGWHGARFDQPLARTREYVEIVRLALERRPLRYQGEHWRLPLPDGAGKPLRLAVRGGERRVPVYLAAIGPRNLELAGEIADGVLVVFFAPQHAAGTLEPLRAGRRRAAATTATESATAAPARRPPADPLDGFEIIPTVPVCLGPDVATAADAVRAHAALYLGGMGSRTHNFYNRLAVRMGFAAEAATVQELFLAGRTRDAAAAVPVEFIDATSLLGSGSRVARRLREYAEAGVTTLSVAPFGTSHHQRLDSLDAVIELARRADCLDTERDGRDGERDEREQTSPPRA
jgi:F420-dependent oxidoreductase-like protein